MNFSIAFIVRYSFNKFFHLFIRFHFVNCFQLFVPLDCFFSAINAILKRGCERVAASLKFYNLVNIHCLFLKIIGR